MLLSSLPERHTRAISLRGHILAALGNRTLRIYRTTSREVRHSWHVPSATTTVDIHFGIALLTAGRSVYALDLASGRTVRIFRAPTRVMAQLEAPGAAFAFNVHGRGNIRFLAMSSIEAQLR